MSRGNIKNEGNKGRNFPFQLSSLEGLQQIANNTQGIVGNLTNILNAVRAHQDMEILLVRDTGNSNIIVKQVNEYDEQTGSWITSYQEISGIAYTPVGPLEYLDASAALALLLAELQTHTILLTAIEADTTAIALSNANLDVLLSSRNAEVTQLLIHALLTSIDADTSNLDVALSTVASQVTVAAILTELQLKADLTETQPVSVTALPLPAGAATQATLAALLTELQLKADLTETQPVSAASLPLPTGASTEATQLLVQTAVEAINTNLTGITRTPGMLRASGVGNVAAGARSVSFYNAGAVAAVVLGANLLPGEQISFLAGAENDVLSAFTYDGTGTDLLIITVV